MTDDTIQGDDGLGTKGQQDGTGHESKVISFPLQDRSKHQQQLKQVSPVGWSAPFSMTKKGLYESCKKKGEIELVHLAGPFEVLGEGRDPEGAGRGVWLGWIDSDDRSHQKFVLRADLVGAGVDWLKALVDCGFSGPVEVRKINKLRQALNGCKTKIRFTMVRRTGWHGSAFVLPNVTIGGAKGESVRFDGRADIARFATKDSLDAWIKKVAVAAANNSRLIFALSVAFSGPIADLLEEESFGFHIYGASSGGKSTALIAAGSVWGGGGPLGFVGTWRVTDNGVEGLARAHSGTFLPLDEIGQVDAEAARALAYMLGNGLGKARSDRSGDPKPVTEWRIVTLSTGEIPISAKLEETGRSGRRHRVKAGQLVRLIDIPADAGSGYGLFEDCGGETAAAFAQRIKANALSCYGSAGQAFVGHIAKMLERDAVRTKDDLRRQIAEVQERLVSNLVGVDGQVTRGARHFALVAVAGEIARAALKLRWAEGAIIDASGKCFEAWMSARGGSEAHEIVTAINALREAIELHGQSRFQVLDSTENSDLITSDRPIHGLLGYKYKVEAEVIWGFTSAGLQEVLRDVGHLPTLARALADRGVIRRGPDDRIQIGKKIAGAKRRLYAVCDATLFADKSDVA